MTAVTLTLQAPDLEVSSFFEDAPIGMAGCTAEGTLYAVNPVLQQLLGLSRQPVQFADLLPVAQRRHSEQLLDELFRNQRESFQLEHEIQSPDGGARWIYWRAWRIRGVENAKGGAVIVAEDVTEQHASEQRVRAAEQLESVGRLAGGIAHDFNNLLTGVLLYCDLLAASLPKQDHLRKYAEEIRRAGMQATGLVRQLLTVARPHPPTSQLLSLNEVAENMRNLLTRLIGENIDLQLQLDPHLGLVRIDPTQAQQILLNLVLNARDAMPQGGHLGVSTSNCKMQILESELSHGKQLALPCAMVVVSDTGIGMDAHTREHLFQAFFSTKAAAGKGTGLGLATVHDIVTRSGGLIHVDSEPGRGTRVTVLLPLIPETALPPEMNECETKVDKIDHDWKRKLKP